jgi:glycosyl transferase, family 25
MSINFQHLNNYFDKIYVLCLPRLTDRIEHIKNNLAGLNYELFEGVDKQNVTLTDFKKKGVYNTEQYHQFYKGNKDMALGMLCCALGHVKIYESILKNNFEKTLILEDDILLTSDGLASFNAIVNELPNNWDLLYLGYEKNETNGWLQKIKKIWYQLFPPYQKLKVTPAMFKKYYPESVSTHLAHAGFHDCTHAYAVTLQGAKNILNHQQPVAFNPDNLLSYLITNNKLNAYIARPKLFNQLSAFKNDVVSLTSD